MAHANQQWFRLSWNRLCQDSVIVTDTHTESEAFSGEANHGNDNELKVHCFDSACFAKGWFQYLDAIRVEFGGCLIGLEKKCWAVRKKQKKDNRIIKVFLTSAGEEKQSQLEDKIDKLGSLIEKETDPFDRSELLEYLWSAHWTISKLLLKNKIV